MRGVGIAAGENFWGFETSENTKNLQKSMFWKTAGGENFWDFATFKKFPPCFCTIWNKGGNTLRVVIHNTLPNVTKIPQPVSKNLEFGFLTALACSHDFLSMIFGIFGKFWIDLGVRKKIRFFFSMWFFFTKNMVLFCVHDFFRFVHEIFFDRFFSI